MFIQTLYYLKNYNLHKKKRGGDGVELDPISLPFSLSEIKYKLILKLHLIVYIIKQNTIMSSLTQHNINNNKSMCGNLI